MGDRATSRKSHSTLLYFDFINANGFPDLLQHIDESVDVNIILFDSPPLLLKCSFHLCLLWDLVS